MGERESELRGVVTPHSSSQVAEAQSDHSDSHQGDSKGGTRGQNDELPTVRYRAPRGRKGGAGLLFAVFVLLVAVLIAAMARERGRRDGEDTSAETTTEAIEETSEPQTNLYAFDPAAVPEGHIAFRPMDLSAAAGEIVNQTDETVDLSVLPQILGGDPSDEAPSGDPIVLILHTHATEAYSPAGAISWDGVGEFARSENGEENVTAVGAVLAEALSGAGITTIHSTVLHDMKDGQGTYSGSYSRAAETIKAFRTLYPSIRLVIDLHRDAVLDADGNAVRAVTEIDGVRTAQIMAVVGCGGAEGDSDHAWQTNLALSLELSNRLSAKYPSLCRAPVLKSSSFNQSLAEYSLLLEIGTAANSLDEAKSAALLVADVLADLIGDLTE